LFILTVVAYIAVLFGIKYVSNALILLAAASTPIMLFLGACSGCGFDGSYGKWMRVICLTILTGLAMFALYTMNYGKEQSGVGLVLYSYTFGSYFVPALVILWVFYGIQHVRDA